MSISINRNSSVPQPTILLEELVQIQAENYAISGAVQRNRIGQKKQATMEYDWLSPSDYQTLIAAFTTGSGIFYNNNASDYAGGIFTFSGLPFFEEDSYIPGASLYRKFKVRIREQ